MTLHTSSSSVSRTQKSDKLQQLHDELAKHGYVFETLGIVGTGFEQFFGEIVITTDPYALAKTDALTMGFVKVRNPKRLMRIERVHPGTGQIAVEIRFSDVDFVNKGLIEVRPVMGFYLDWLDEESQVRYCEGLRNYLDAKRLAQAKASGIVIPDGPMAPPHLLRK
jgi:hypothetical protein